MKIGGATDVRENVRKRSKKERQRKRKKEREERKGEPDGETKKINIALYGGGISAKLQLRAQAGACHRHGALWEIQCKP